MARLTWKAGNMLNPLPVVMVTSEYNNKTNVFTVAWCGNICTNPAMVSISVRKSRYSYDLIKESGEFVINLVTENLVKACDYAGVKSGRDVDKIKTLGLHLNKIDDYKTPGLLESPVNLVCKLEQIIELGSHDLFIAKVMAVNVDDSLLDETGRLDLAKAHLVSYSHGEYYTLGNYLGKFGFSVKK